MPDPIRNTLSTLQEAADFMISELSTLEKQFASKKDDFQAARAQVAIMQLSNRDESWQTPFQNQQTLYAAIKAVTEITLANSSPAKEFVSLKDQVKPFVNANKIYAKEELIISESKSAAILLDDIKPVNAKPKTAIETYMDKAKDIVREMKANPQIFNTVGDKAACKALEREINKQSVVKNVNDCDPKAIHACLMHIYVRQQTGRGGPSSPSEVAKKNTVEKMFSDDTGKNIITEKQKDKNFNDPAMQSMIDSTIRRDTSQAVRNVSKNTQQNPVEEKASDDTPKMRR